jgi:hydroxyethylthiazole kinase-like uncharacterized protein yjeF
MNETFLTPALLANFPLPDPDQDGGKERRGRVLVVAGSRELPGAAILAGTGALRVGAGKLQIATGRSVAPYIGVAVPEARTIGLPETKSGAIAVAATDTVCSHARECKALLIGPGLMDAKAACSLAATILSDAVDVPAIVDAAAMMRLRQHVDAIGGRATPIIVTPHTGEMAGILSVDKREVEAAPASFAVALARELRCIVVLKGRTTWITESNGGLWRHDDGHIGLATSGSGDVLAGFMAGLLARGAEPVHAALWAVVVHAQAGERLAASMGPIGYLARDLLPQAPLVLTSLAESN